MVGDGGELVIPKLTTRYNVVIFPAHTIATRQSRRARIAVNFSGRLPRLHNCQLSTVNCQLFAARETDRKLGVISYDREQYYLNSRS